MSEMKCKCGGKLEQVMRRIHERDIYRPLKDLSNNFIYKCVECEEVSRFNAVTGELVEHTNKVSL